MEESLKQTTADCIRVVLFGPESTGKTSLCRDLAAYYNTLWVPEFMRDYLENKMEQSGEGIHRDDLLKIAKGQMTTENKAAERANLIFCDTNLLQLKVYSQYYYDGFVPPALTEAANKAQYDCYLLCGIDVPWEEDPLRDRPFDRTTLFRIFEAELKITNQVFHHITGGREDRMRQATAIVDNLLNLYAR